MLCLAVKYLGRSYSGFALRMLEASFTHHSGGNVGMWRRGRGEVLQVNVKLLSKAPDLPSAHP